MRMPLEWHQKCLENEKTYLRDRQQALSDLARFIARLEAKIACYERKIQLAIEEGKDVFDDDEDKDMSKCESCNEPRPETELERLRKDAARYNWLAGKVFARGETCLALIEEFGGAPFKGETIRQFVDRFIDAALTAGEKGMGKTMDETDEGGPAFPVADTYHPNGQVLYGSGGMTLRDYFAAKALQALVHATQTMTNVTTTMVAEEAYVYADAMLAARGR